MRRPRKIQKKSNTKRGTTAKKKEGGDGAKRGAIDRLPDTHQQNKVLRQRECQDKRVDYVPPPPLQYLPQPKR